MKKSKCSKCKKFKPVYRFRKRSDSKNGLQYWCRSCENRANKHRYRLKKRRRIKKSNPVNDDDKKRDAKDRVLKFRYGIGIDEYEKIYENQNKKCAICLEDYPLGGYSGLYVDHCHKTGEVRGLLCPRCNSLLGKFMEDKEIIDRAIKYLKS